MNLKYATSESNLDGMWDVHSNKNMRVWETQALFLDVHHLPISQLVSNQKVYDGDLLFNIGKGGFWKPYIKWLYEEHNDCVNKLKKQFPKVYIYQDGEIGWWNREETRLQAWWYNQLSTADGILVPNSTDVDFYKGIFPHSDIRVIRSVMTDIHLDKTKFKPKEDRVILNGPLTTEYSGFPQVILAHNTGMGIDIPSMGQERMPKDSWDMASNLGINYLQYMSWNEWMYNLNRYKIGYMLTPAIASASFALNCAYLGIPCIGYDKADAQRILFPELSIDVFNNRKALELTLKLTNDKVFYDEVSMKAKEMYQKEFTKERMLEILEETYIKK